MKSKYGYLIVLMIMALSISSCTGFNFSLGPKSNTVPTTPAISAPQATVPPVSAPPQPKVQSSSASAEGVAALEGTLENIYSFVSPSVVNLRVISKSTGISSAAPDLPQIPGLPFNTPDQQNPAPKQEGLGSGFVWDMEGHIVTNNHVISGAEQVTVTFSDGTIVEGKVVGADPDSDLAVVKVDTKPELLKPVQMADSSQVKVGEIAVAIGNPFGLQGTMTMGIISALGRSLPSGAEGSNNNQTYTIPSIIQTDAPINPGNSGGVLVNDQGQVIGVTSAIESPIRANAGIGFAIPSSIVQKFIPELIRNGKVEHPWIGILGTNLNPDLAKLMGIIPDERGILVLDVTTGSPADKAGLQGSVKDVELNGSNTKVGGDIITSINGLATKDFDSLVAYLYSSTNVGDSVKLTIIRNGKQETLDLSLVARPTQTASVQNNQPETTVGKARLGVATMDLNPQIAKALNLAEDTKGVLIKNIQQGSPADKAGLHGSDKSITLNGEDILVGGDIITKLNEKLITTTRELQTELGQYKPGDEISLTILRDTKETIVKVTL